MYMLYVYIYIYIYIHIMCIYVCVCSKYIRVYYCSNIHFRYIIPAANATVSSTSVLWSFHIDVYIYIGQPHLNILTEVQIYEQTYIAMETMAIDGGFMTIYPAKMITQQGTSLLEQSYSCGPCEISGGSWPRTSLLSWSDGQNV